MSSRCHHEASRSFVGTWWTSVAGPNTLHQHFETLQFWACEGMFWNMLRCFWLPGLDFCATMTSHLWASEPTDHGTLKHTIFTEIDCTEVARCTLSVCCSTEIDYCVVFIVWVGVFLEHIHRTLKASERFKPNFPDISLHFACLLAHVTSTTTAATFT